MIVSVFNMYTYISIAHKIICSQSVNMLGKNKVLILQNKRFVSAKEKIKTNCAAQATSYRITKPNIGTKFSAYIGVAFKQVTISTISFI